MNPSAASAQYTWDDFIALDEDDLRELIDGELVEVEVPTSTHEEIVASLIYFLGAWVHAGHGARSTNNKASSAANRISSSRSFRPRAVATTA
jgi:Uma2 family endonuclease